MAKATDDRLRLLIERIERLEEEKKGLADDIADVYAEAKAVGYDAKIMRMIVRLRAMKPDDRAEQDTILEAYKSRAGARVMGIRASLPAPALRRPLGALVRVSASDAVASMLLRLGVWVDPADPDAARIDEAAQREAA